VVEQDHPILGRIQLPNLPFRFSGFDATIRDVAPELGEHNESIAASLGFSAEEIAEMRRDGVLYDKPATPKVST
jgi:crotonobetainyl-CoA:carnitine CoA-transferase CaiB-like acyl-CoA transferase